MSPKRKSHPPGRAPGPESESTSGTIYFYMLNAKPYGVFCQWHTSHFFIPTSSLQFLSTNAPNPTTATALLAAHASFVGFPCAEQSYMFCKALFFSSVTSCARILSSQDQKEQKKVGRQIPDFSEWHWDKIKSRVARVGNWYKFTDGRNARMRDVLMGTGERELAEASRRDRVWGIGYNEEEAERYRGILGENLLGKCLVDVRGR
jgi:ribA/ribD-fused uncharacterized protein